MKNSYTWQIYDDIMTHYVRKQKIHIHTHTHMLCRKTENSHKRKLLL